jgi:hypothetical protein
MERELIDNMTSLVATTVLIRQFTQRRCRTILREADSPDGAKASPAAVFFLIGANAVVDALTESLRSSPMTSFDQFARRLKELEDEAMGAAEAQGAPEAAS